MKAIHNYDASLDNLQMAAVNIVKPKNESNSQQDTGAGRVPPSCCKYR